MEKLKQVSLLIHLLEIFFVTVFGVYLVTLGEQYNIFGLALLSCVAALIIILPLYLFWSRQNKIYTISLSDLVTISSFVFSGPSLITQLVNIWSHSHNKLVS